VKKLAVLGSTGSIGRQTLDVVRNNSGMFKVEAICAKKNIKDLVEQVREFSPSVVAIQDRTKANALKQELAGLDVEILEGEQGIIDCASNGSIDIVVNGIVGIAGLMPTMAAIEAGNDVALANKETMVAGGRLVTERARAKGVNILPVDSEHSAIFQCIGNTKREQVKRLILTASGGPFHGMDADRLMQVTVEDALKHPNWKMGHKITVDSATLMNKGLEVIEARWFFGIEARDIDVVIHPQSVIHSMVEFIDGALLAQMGSADMRIPIQYALTYPDRVIGNYTAFKPLDIGRLEFYPPDYQNFRCLKLAYHAIEAGGTMPVVLNGANEKVVELFLNGSISFTDIPTIVEKVMEKHGVVGNPSLDDILYWDRWSREQVDRITGKE
jgi:1-deoxy-D-xylulose-5-phosphate reductoisomerase